MSVADAGLSERGLEHYKHGEMKDGYEMLYGNLYNPETNPTGYINLGVSENVSPDSELRSFDLLSTAPPVFISHEVVFNCTQPLGLLRYRNPKTCS
jgi:hypothetical protein